MTATAWFAPVELTDPEDGSLIDLTGEGVTATLTLRNGTQSDRTIASTDDGSLTFPRPGVAVWSIPALAIRDVPPGTYECGLMATKAGATFQGALNLSIQEGL